MPRSVPLALLAALAAAAPARAAGDLPDKVQAILKANCHRCHGLNGSKEGGMDYVLDHKQLVAKRKVAPGNADKSKILARMKDGDMPPDGENPRPTPEEIAVVEEWVKAGARAWGEAATAGRARRDDAHAVKAILDDLRAATAHDRPFLRYFTLIHLSKNPKVTDADLRLYRAALSKAVNSLSWERDLVVPRAIDADGLVYAVDLRKLGWVRDHLWRRILRSYPYGLQYDESQDSSLREPARQAYQLSGTEVPFVRADWFVATATRPPLYHDLLRLPTHAGELEHRLGVSVARNFRDDRLVRAGFARSGVSRQNRLVERHPSSFGAYWKSYDFKTNDGTGNLFRLPLGPDTLASGYEHQGFRHDGGEVIFHLPNGLQGYLLLDGKDNRIDAGPLEVVRDKNETSGSVAIVTGVSCMACHAHGMIDFKDEVRLGNALNGTSRERVERLFPRPEEADRLVARDRNQFLLALTEVAGPFLQVGPDARRPITEFEEPVGKLARLYSLAELSAGDAAAELGLADGKELAAVLKANRELAARLGLTPLATGGFVKREVWESQRLFTSPFQEAARALEIGKPVVVR